MLQTNLLFSLIAMTKMQKRVFFYFAVQLYGYCNKNNIVIKMQRNSYFLFINLLVSFLFLVYSIGVHQLHQISTITPTERLQFRHFKT